MSDTLSIFLGVLGAIGGVLLVWEFGKKVHNEIILYLSGRFASEKGYRYDYIEIGDRWLREGKHVVSNRVHVVTSNQNYVESIRFGVGPSSKGRVSFVLLEGPGNLRKVESTRSNADWEDYIFEFSVPLRKGHSARIVTRTEIVAHRGIVLPNRLSWISNRRVDRLVLKSASKNILPVKAYSHRVDGAGLVSQRNDIDIDVTSHECRIELNAPIPGYMYMLIWEYDDENVST
ncbi:MAG: hypothetical protein IAE99_12735 [Rhodothermales bacterium]|nr:hypothetical protein [Rhodothermales bacterium]